MSWIISYLLIGSFLAAYALGTIKNINVMNILGCVLVILFWPWIVWYAMGRCPKDKEPGGYLSCDKTAAIEKNFDAIKNMSRPSNKKDKEII